MGLPADAVVGSLHRGVYGIGAVVGHGAHGLLYLLLVAVHVGRHTHVVDGAGLQSGDVHRLVLMCVGIVGQYVVRLHVVLAGTQLELHGRLAACVAGNVEAGLDALLSDGPVLRAPRQSLQRLGQFARAEDERPVTGLHVEADAVLHIGIQSWADGLEGTLGQLSAQCHALHAGIVAAYTTIIICEAILGHLTGRDGHVRHLERGLTALRLGERHVEVDDLQHVDLSERLASLIAIDDDTQVGVGRGCHLVLTAVGAADVGPRRALVR